MKITLPSFAIIALWASFLLAQADRPPPTFSIPAPHGDDSAISGRDLSAGELPADTRGRTPVPDAQAMQLFEQVAATLAQHRSIAARVRYRVELFGTQTIGSGTYLQQGSEAQRQIRLELKTPVGKEVATLQQIMDGRYLWQFSDFGNKPSLTRVDTRRVRMAGQQARGATAQMLRTMAIGGLPQLVDGLGRSFQLIGVEAGELEQMPVWVATATWRPEALTEISPDLVRQAAAGKRLSLKKLPPQLPEQVVLYVGRDDLFPYRIEYQRRPADKGRGDAASGEPVAMMIAEFYEVRFDAQIDPKQFAYDPGKLEVLDGTESFLKTVEGK